MTEKRFIYNMFDITGNFEENKLKLYEIDNNPSDDLDESNLFYMYSSSESNIKSIVDKLNSLVNENEQLKMQLQNTSAQRDEFLRGARENANRVGKLKKENEELKSELNKQTEITTNLGDFREFITKEQVKLNKDYNRLKEENKKLKQSKKGQELEIVRLHHLADAMSGVLRELGIYDVYNKEQIDKVKKELKRND